MDRIPDKLPFSKRRLRPRVVISYILDYVILIALVIGFWILDSIEPYHQRFSLNNISLQYPYADPERISIVAAVACSGGGPLIIIAVYTLLIDGLFSHKKPVKTNGKRKFMGPYRFKDRLWEFNCGFLGLILSQALTFVITQALKNACGKPRPDIIDRCKPRAGSADGVPFGLSDYSICTGDPHLLKDGFRSWPSGHSSSSFAGLFYLSLWIGGKLHIMDNKGEVWKMFLTMFPCLGATLIAVSRIMDARHHPFDVITGSLLGILCASISYRQYFPSLAEPWKKGRAYPIRAWGTEPTYPGAYGAGDSTAALRNPEEERMREHEHESTENSGAVPHPQGYPVQRNPFVTDVYPSRHDGNWSSSSEEDVTNGNGYEMQQGYARTHNPEFGNQLPTYEPGMAYHSQTQAPMQMQPGLGPESGSGPLYPEAVRAPSPRIRANEI